MNKKITLSLIIILTSFLSYSQLLKDSDIIFRNFKAYSKVGNNLTGKLVKTGEANTKISVSSIEINTFIAIETTLIGGEQVYIVRNVNKEIKSEKLICNIECYNGQDPQKKLVKYIFEYVDNKLTKVYFPLESGIMEFY